MRYEDVKPLWGDQRPSSVIKMGRGEKRETVIQHMRGDEQCRIWTNEIWWINQLCKWAEKRPLEVEFEEFSEQGVTALVPLSWMRTMRPKRVRKMSEADREKMRENIKRAREMRLSQKRANDE